jgi:hypothetical protein
MEHSADDRCANAFSKFIVAPAYTLHIDKLIKESERRLKDFEHMKVTMSCITNIFKERQISESVGLPATVFEENEVN